MPGKWVGSFAGRELGISRNCRPLITLTAGFVSWPERSKRERSRRPTVGLNEFAMTGNSGVGKVWRPLAADVRQALVGWAVLLAIPLAGALLLAALAGRVPAWSLALVLAVCAILVAAISLEHRRELGRVEGSLAAERERRISLEGEITKAQQRASGQADGGLRQSLLFRIQTLREEVIERRDAARSTTTAQDRAIQNLAIDIRTAVGPSATLDQIVQEWTPPVYNLNATDASAALGQMQGIAMSAPDH
jgi:hypothetical protein